MKKIKYFGILLLVFAPIAVNSQIKAKLEQECYVDGENRFKIENYEKIVAQNPTAEFTLRVGNKSFPLTRDDFRSSLVANVNPKEIEETAKSDGVVSAKITGKKPDGVVLEPLSPVILSDIRQFNWELSVNFQMISIQNKSNLRGLATACLESITFINDKGISQTIDRKNGLQLVRNGIARIYIEKSFNIEQSKLFVKYFGNSVQQEIITRKNPDFSVSSETKCFSFQNRFVLKDKELLKNPAITFYLQYYGKEFPLSKNEETGELFGDVGDADVPLESKSDLMVRIVGKYENGKKIYSNDVRMYSARNFYWTFPPSVITGFDRKTTSERINFQSKDPKDAYAANHCIESVTFVDAKGFSKTYTRKNGLNSTKGGYGSVLLNPQEFSAGQGKFIFKHFGNPATQEVPIMLYEKPPENIKIQLSTTDRNGIITGKDLDMIPTPGEGIITYCPKNHFEDAKKSDPNWTSWSLEYLTKGCKERRVRIQSGNNTQRNFVDYERTPEMIANSDAVAFLTVELADKRKFSYMFTFQN